MTTEYREGFYNASMKLAYGLLYYVKDVFEVDSRTALRLVDSLLSIYPDQAHFFVTAALSRPRRMRYDRLHDLRNLDRIQIAELAPSALDIYIRPELIGRDMETHCKPVFIEFERQQPVATTHSRWMRLFERWLKPG
jgi:hypothetical protein